MKKYKLFIALIGMIALQSCTTSTPAPVTNTVNNTVVNEVWEFTNINFTTANNFSTLITFPHSIYSSDMVLVYRLSGSTSNGTDVWSLQPENYFYSDGTLNYGYNSDFTKYDVSLYMIGNGLSGIASADRLNQIYRVVVLPGYFGNKMANNVNFNDYNAVIKAFHIDDSKLK